MKNVEIRFEAMCNDIFLYEIADKMKISHSTFYRMMRKELQNNEKARIQDILEELAIERGVAP